jgi:hypothetical protein
MPLWSVQIILLVIAIWKIKNVLRYRNSTTLFINEVGGDWIDKTKLEKAKKLFIAHEATLFIFILPFSWLLYLESFKPIAWHVLITFLIVWFCAYLWWTFHFTAKNK